VARTHEETFMTPTFARRLASLAAVSTLAVCGLASAQTGGPSAAEMAPPGANKPP
jgi:hypothetical protein